MSKRLSLEQLARSILCKGFSIVGAALECSKMPSDASQDPVNDLFATGRDLLKARDEILGWTAKAALLRKQLAETSNEHEKNMLLGEELEYIQSRLETEREVLAKFAKKHLNIMKILDAVLVLHSRLCRRRTSSRVYSN